MIAQPLVVSDEDQKLSLGKVEIASPNDTEFSKTIIENALIFDEDLAVVYQNGQWFLADRLLGIFLHNTGFQENELSMLALTLIYMEKNGRSEDGILGSREFMVANVQATDRLRSGNKFSPEEQEIIANFIKMVKNFDTLEYSI